jgi:hypothetical protein
LVRTVLTFSKILRPPTMLCLIVSHTVAKQPGAFEETFPLRRTRPPGRTSVLLAFSVMLRP